VWSEIADEGKPTVITETTFTGRYHIGNTALSKTRQAMEDASWKQTAVATNTMKFNMTTTF